MLSFGWQVTLSTHAPTTILALTDSLNENFYTWATTNPQATDICDDGGMPTCTNLMLEVEFVSDESDDVYIDFILDPVRYESHLCIALLT